MTRDQLLAIINDQINRGLQSANPVIKANAEALKNNVELELAEHVSAGNRNIDMFQRSGKMVYMFWGAIAMIPVAFVAGFWLG